MSTSAATTLVPTTVGEDLARYRYHTGAQPRRLADDEPCPPLFRDIGMEPMARFLQGQLTQLCGIHSPITYLRSADYREPYVDHGCIGRVMLLRPEVVNPWHSGIETVYIASRTIKIDPQSMIFIPAQISLPEAADRFQEAVCLDEVMEIVGKSEYQSMRWETRFRLNELMQTHAQSEKAGASLRRKYQSMKQGDREVATKWMSQLGLTESDLCTAWHHIPTTRRDLILAALCELPEVLT